MVASGLPTESDLFHGLSWTEEDVKEMRKLEEECVVSDIQPEDQWFMEIEEGES
jgi:hypothetical protein